MQNATDLIQVISCNAGEGWTLLKTFFADVNWSKFVATTFSAFLAAGAVSYFSNRSLNKRDKIQAKREEHRDRHREFKERVNQIKQKARERKAEQQQEINACNFYTNSVRLQMFDLFSLATQKECFEDDLRCNLPLKPNGEYELTVISGEEFNLISNISPKSMDDYFSAKFHMKRLNEGLDYVLSVGYDFEREIEIEKQDKGSSGANLMANINQRELTKEYAENVRALFYDIKNDDAEIVREGIYTIATRFYLDIFFSLACMQQDAINKSIELDITKNDNKYFAPQLIKYFNTDEAIRLIEESPSAQFSHANLVEAYLDNPDDILNAAEKLAAKENTIGDKE